jgi:hypothetical protein
MPYYIQNFICHGNDINTSNFNYYFYNSTGLIEDHEWEQGYVSYDEAKKILLKYFKQDDEGVMDFLQNRGDGWCFGEKIYHKKNNVNECMYLPIKQ